MQRYNYSLKFESLPIKNHIKFSSSHHHNTTPGALLQHNICISNAQYCELSARRNLWCEILEFWACKCYCAYCQCVICGDERKCAKNRWVKKLHFIPNVLLLLSIRATFAMQFGYSWLANVVLLQCKEAPFEGLKSHRRCQTL